MSPQRGINQQIDDLFASPGPAAMIPADMIPALSAAFSAHRDDMHAQGHIAAAQRAEEVLDQLAHLYRRAHHQQ